MEQKAVGTNYIPVHKFKNNFLDYYDEYVTNNKKKGNRHLEGSFNKFKTFLKKSYLPPIDITENLCMRYRTYLLKNFTGKTPADYFHAFKRVIKAAWKEGYTKVKC